MLLELIDVLSALALSENFIIFLPDSVSLICFFTFGASANAFSSLGSAIIKSSSEISISCCSMSSKADTSSLFVLELDLSSFDTLFADVSVFDLFSKSFSESSFLATSVCPLDLSCLSFLAKASLAS